MRFDSKHVCSCEFLCTNEFQQRVLRFTRLRFLRFVKDGETMIPDLIALLIANFLAISAAGIFWSGQFDSAEKKERRRVARLIGRKYPRTY
jgi:hypothetical protein